MVLGALGETIVFEVSGETVKTIEKMKWGGSSRWATHQRHGTDAMSEFTGRNADTFQFEMILSAYLGVNPQTVIGLLFTAMRNGTTLPFVLGNKAYGKYRGVITKLNVNSERFDGDGDMTQAKVSVNLQEYLNW